MDITAEQIQAWQNKIEAYKEKYASLYPQDKPTEKCLISFCKLNGIPWPLPQMQTEENEWDFLD